MSYKKWLIGAIAECQECDFYDSNYITAQKAASNHHKKTKHKVDIELAYAGKYD